MSDKLVEKLRSYLGDKPDYEKRLNIIIEEINNNRKTFNNGRKKKADGTMANYVCPSSGGGNVAPKTTTTVTKKSTGTGTGTGVVAQSNVKQVQKLVGVAETGVFDTATAKAVRTKLGA